MKKQLAAVLAAGMILTGCGGADYDTIDTTYDTTVLKDWFLSTSGEVDTWNYLNQASAANTRVLVNLESGLLDHDQYGSVVGDLAETWTSNDDKTVWTFTLRDGINWYRQDGSVYAPITAEDFVTGIEYVLNPKNASVCTEMATSNLVGAAEYNAGTLTDFSKVGVKALDEKTVEFTCVAGAPYFESTVLYSSFYPVSADYLKEVGDKFGTGPESILYSGTYLIKSYTNDNEKTLVANPEYWDYDNVKVKTVQMIAVKDTESTKELFERGELSWCTLAGTQPTAEDRNGNPYMFKSEAAACAYVMFLNNENANADTKAALNNEDFRKALYYGWDKRGFVEMVDPLDPESIYTYTYTSPNTFFTSDGTDYVNLPALKEWNQNLYNPELAAEYMAKARETLEASGVTFPIELQYYYRAGNETAGQSAEILKATMEEAFPDDVTVTLGEYSQSYLTEVSSKQLQAMVGIGWIPDYLDPTNILYTLLPNGYMNNTVDINNMGYSHFDMPEFVELYKKAAAEVVDLDKRYNLFAEAEAYLFEHAYFLPLYQAGSSYQMTSWNPYSRTYSLSGGVQYRYKLIDLSNHACTAEEIAGFKEAWQAERKERGLAG